MPYLSVKFNLHQDPRQDYGSGGTNNILDVFDNDNTQANFLETLSSKSVISKKWRDHGPGDPGNGEQNTSFCRKIIQNSDKRLRLSFL